MHEIISRSNSEKNSDPVFFSPYFFHYLDSYTDCNCWYYQNINQRRTAWSIILELTPNMPPIFSGFFLGKPRPGVPQTEQAILRKPQTLRVKTTSCDPKRGGDIPTTKLTSLKSGIKASDVPQWLWTRDECRAWMYAVLIHYLNVSKLVTLGFPPYRALYIESVLWYPSQ